MSNILSDPQRNDSSSALYDADAVQSSDQTSWDGLLEWINAENLFDNINLPPRINASASFAHSGIRKDKGNELSRGLSSSLLSLNPNLNDTSPMDMVSNDFSSNRYKLYSENDMCEAVKAVKDGSMNVLTASKKFGIPSRTLYDRIGKLRIPLREIRRRRRSPCMKPNFDDIVVQSTLFSDSTIGNKNVKRRAWMHLMENKNLKEETLPQAWSGTRSPLFLIPQRFDTDDCDLKSETNYVGCAQTPSISSPLLALELTSEKEEVFFEKEPKENSQFQTFTLPFNERGQQRDIRSFHERMKPEPVKNIQTRAPPIPNSKPTAGFWSVRQYKLNLHQRSRSDPDESDQNHVYSIQTSASWSTQQQKNDIDELTTAKSNTDRDSEVSLMLNTVSTSISKSTQQQKLVDNLCVSSEFGKNDDSHMAPQNSISWKLGANRFIKSEVSDGGQVCTLFHHSIFPIHQQKVEINGNLNSECENSHSQASSTAYSTPSFVPWSVQQQYSTTYKSPKSKVQNDGPQISISPTLGLHTLLSCISLPLQHQKFDTDLSSKLEVNISRQVSDSSIPYAVPFHIPSPVKQVKEKTNKCSRSELKGDDGKIQASLSLHTVSPSVSIPIIEQEYEVNENLKSRGNNCGLVPISSISQTMSRHFPSLSVLQQTLKISGCPEPETDKRKTQTSSNTFILSSPVSCKWRVVQQQKFPGDGCLKSSANLIEQIQEPSTAHTRYSSTPWLKTQVKCRLNAFSKLESPKDIQAQKPLTQLLSLSNRADVEDKYFIPATVEDGYQIRSSITPYSSPSFHSWSVQPHNFKMEKFTILDSGDNERIPVPPTSPNEQHVIPSPTQQIKLELMNNVLRPESDSSEQVKTSAMLHSVQPSFQMSTIKQEFGKKKWLKSEVTSDVLTPTTSLVCVPSSSLQKRRGLNEYNNLEENNKGICTTSLKMQIIHSTLNKASENEQVAALLSPPTVPCLEEYLQALETNERLKLETIVVNN